MSHFLYENHVAINLPTTPYIIFFLHLTENDKAGRNMLQCITSTDYKFLCQWKIMVIIIIIIIIITKSTDYKCLSPKLPNFI
jgi:hypothetical protein